MTFAELTELHQRHLQSLLRNPKTLYTHRLLQGQFADFCQNQLGVTDPRHLQPQHFAAYLKHLTNTNLTRLGQYSRQRQLRTWLAWATYQGHLLIDPAKDFAWKHPPLLPRDAPSVEQVQQLLAAPDDSFLGQRDQALMEFLYGTGARIGEALACDVDDLNLQAAEVLIRHGKGGYQRTLPLGPHLVSVLRRYLEQSRPCFPGAQESPALWLTLKARRLSVCAFNYRVWGYAKPLGLDVSSYSFRHAFATHLLARGAPLPALQRLMGHQTLNMTTRYTHLVPVDIQKMIRECHPRARRRGRGREHSRIPE